MNHPGAVAKSPRESGQAKEPVCLNCRSPLTDAYCAVCGQKAHLPRSLRDFATDMFQGMFNFEGKIWHTLPLLAWKPGELTRRYVAGERARFVSPAALYLFTVFAMFAVLNFTGAIGQDATPKTATSLSQAVAAERRDLARLERERIRAVEAERPTVDIDRQIADRRKSIEQTVGLQNGKLVIVSDDGDQTPPWLSKLVQRVEKNPSEAVFRVQDATSKFSWLLIPLSLPFMWLLFPFSGRYRLYDHAVFVTYSLSFMMLLVILGGLLVAAGAPSLGSMLFFVPPVHIFRQLKGAYELSRLSALLRTVALLLFCFVAMLLFAAAMVAIGIF